jgi:hypothetical protein
MLFSRLKKTDRAGHPVVLHPFTPFQSPRAHAPSAGEAKQTLPSTGIGQQIWKTEWSGRENTRSPGAHVRRLIGYL